MILYFTFWQNERSNLDWVWFNCIRFHRHAVRVLMSWWIIKLTTSNNMVFPLHCYNNHIFQGFFILTCNIICLCWSFYFLLYMYIMHVQKKIEGLAQTYLSVSFLLPKGNCMGAMLHPCKISDDIHTHLSILLNDYVISKENIMACKKKV